MGWTSSRVTLCRDGLIVWTSCRLEDLGGFWISAVLMTLDSNCRGHSQMWQSTMLGPWIFPACTYVLCNSWMQKDSEKFKDALELQTRKTKSMQYIICKLLVTSHVWLGWLSFNWTRMYASKAKVRACHVPCSPCFAARNGMWVISKVQSVQSVRPLPRWHPRLWVWVMRTKRNQWWFIALVAFAVPWKKYQKKAFASFAIRSCFLEG